MQESWTIRQVQNIRNISIWGVKKIKAWNLRTTTFSFPADCFLAPPPSGAPFFLNPPCWTWIFDVFCGLVVRLFPGESAGRILSHFTNPSPEIFKLAIHKVESMKYITVLASSGCLHHITKCHILLSKLSYYPPSNISLKGTTLQTFVSIGLFCKVFSIHCPAGLDDFIITPSP